MNEFLIKIDNSIDLDFSILLLTIVIVTIGLVEFGVYIKSKSKDRKSVV